MKPKVYQPMKPIWCIEPPFVCKKSPPRAGSLPGNQSGLHIALQKRIPSQAGLGGGSSDAAAALLAVNDLLRLALSHRLLTEIASALGGDVPFFLTGGTALVEGLGEKVTSLPALHPPWHLIVVKPACGVSTSAAYAALDALPGRCPGTATNAMLHNEMRLGNDFEKVILPAFPAIAAVYAVLDQTTQTDESYKPLLCGSGSCLFRRVSTRAEGESVARKIMEAGLGKAWITSTQGANQ